MDTDINDILGPPTRKQPSKQPRWRRANLSTTAPLTLRYFCPPTTKRTQPRPRTRIANARNDATNNPDIDALFEGLDDIDDSFQELAPCARPRRAPSRKLMHATRVPCVQNSVLPISRQLSLLRRLRRPRLRPTEGEAAAYWMVLMAMV